VNSLRLTFRPGSPYELRLPRPGQRRVGPVILSGPPARRPNRLGGVGSRARI